MMLLGMLVKEHYDNLNIRLAKRIITYIIHKLTYE